MKREPTLDQLISDVAILPRDLEASIAFYQGKLGFELQHRMPGFADFRADGVRLALWEHSHFAEHVGFARQPAPANQSVMIAVHVPTIADVDSWHERLVAAGVDVQVPPADYPAWNARSLYFSGPDSEVWEIYAWFDGGEPGKV